MQTGSVEWQAMPAVLGRRADTDVGDEFISGLGVLVPQKC